jgi:hypothetical protein
MTTKREDRDEAFGRFVEDLRRAAELLAGHGASAAHRGAGASR